MEYQSMFEVIDTESNRVAICFADISAIKQTSSGSVIFASGIDDIETTEEYELLKIRFERQFESNRKIIDNEFEARWNQARRSIV